MLVSSEDLSIAIPTRHTLIRSTFKLVLFQGWQHIKMSDRCSGMNRGTMERGEGQLPDFEVFEVCTSKTLTLTVWPCVGLHQQL